jgi:hypothetical protein
MGIQKLLPYLESNKVFRNCDIRDFKNQVVAVDGTIFLVGLEESSIDFNE